MRYQLKLTLCITVLLAVVFGVGGSVLITVSGAAALESEKQTATASYRMLQRALSVVNSVGSQSGADDLKDTLYELDSQNGSGAMGIIMTDEEETIYISRGVDESLFELNETVPEGKCAVIVKNYDDKYIIVVSGNIKTAYRDLRLDSAYDITRIYENRRTQEHIYMWLYAAVLVIGAAVAWGTSVVLTKPVKDMSATARRITSGELSARVRVRGNDELSALAEDFNTMTQNLQDNILELKDSYRRQEEFIGSFAHEMKTPMTSIIGYSELLRNGTLNETESREAASYIFLEGRRLESLSFKLLELLVADKRRLEMNLQSPKQLISSVVSVMKPELQKKGILLQSRCEDGVCLLEPDLVKSLIINLIDNAKKAMDGGGNILVLSTMTEEGCRIRIADNGRGMPSEAIERITEAFYRVDKSRSREQGGAGLGLALCKKIADLHNGTISFESRLGKGTCVTVELKGGVGSETED